MLHYTEQLLNAALHSFAALAFLTAMGAFGVVVLKRAAPFLEPLEQTLYGFVLGVVIASLAIVPFAGVIGLSAALVLVSVVGVVTMLVLALGRSPLSSLRAAGITRSIATIGHFGASMASAVRVKVHLVPALVIGIFVLRWAIFWSGGLTYTAEGLWAGHEYIWSDWSLHLGNVTSFVYGDNFPPVHPRLVGNPLGYHYLTSVTAAVMVTLGLDPAGALTLHSFVFSVLITLSLYVFVRRLTKDSGAATLALVLFLLGGAPGWLITVQEMTRSQSVLGTLLQHPWDQHAVTAARYLWHNAYFSFIAPQRAFLYGLPLGMLILTVLHEAIHTQRSRLFLLAGLVAGLLPLAHLATMLALALITPFLFLLFPSRAWVRFFGAWIIVAVPQFVIQWGGGPGAASALRLQLGWVAPPDPWIWFWLRNLGFFLPLFGVALADRSLVPALTRRFLWGFMPLFVIANVVVFQPWDWYNHAMLLYWFLAVSILVATLVSKVWRTHRAPAMRLLVGGVVASMLLSGVLINLHQLLGKDRVLLLTPEELRLAEAVRNETPPHALFVVGLQPNHPVPVMAGRRVLMSYPGWLWAEGHDFGQREQDLRAIYAFASNAPQLLKDYHVDYVVIGPFERDQLAANVSAYRKRYTTIIKTDKYEVFAVGEG